MRLDAPTDAVAARGGNVGAPPDDGAIRFTADRTVSADVLTEIVRRRMTEIDGGS